MADHNVVLIKSTDEWLSQLDAAANAKKVIVVDFKAVDVDELQEVAETWDVQAMPTFIFIENKKLLFKIVGANKDELKSKCTQLTKPDSNA